MYNILYEFTDTLDIVNIDDTFQFDTCTMYLYVNLKLRVFAYFCHLHIYDDIRYL